MLSINSEETNKDIVIINITNVEIENLNLKVLQDVFSNLTQDQLRIKTNNQKQQFIDLFNDITDILERLSVVNKDSNIVDTLNYVNDSLSDLREMIRDSLTDSFNTRSFVENQIILERFITIYTMLIKILEKVSNKKQSEDNSNNKNKRE